MLALLRAMASSPAAAASTLRKRAETVNAKDPEEVEKIGRQRVLDLGDDAIARSRASTDHHVTRCSLSSPPLIEVRFAA